MTSVYIKPIYDNQTLSYLRKAPLKYKVFTIKTLLHREFAVSSSWSTFHYEVTRFKRLLNNNNFTIEIVDEEIYKFVSSKVKNQRENKGKNYMNLFFCNRITKHHEKKGKIESHHVQPYPSL